MERPCPICGKPFNPVRGKNVKRLAKTCGPRCGGYLARGKKPEYRLCDGCGKKILWTASRRQQVRRNPGQESFCSAKCHIHSRLKKWPTPAVGHQHAHRRLRARYREQGLNAHGRPYRRPPTTPSRSTDAAPRETPGREPPPDEGPPSPR